MKVLIVQLGRIGDMILLTPVFRALKEKYPNAEIDVLAGRHNYSVIMNNPCVEQVIVYEKTPLKLLGTINRLRKKNYDYLIDPKDHPSSESRLFARLIRAKTKIGLNSGGYNIYDIGIDPESENAGRHYTLRCLKALEPLGIDPEKASLKPELLETPESRLYVEEFLSQIAGDNPYILLNISSSRQDKMWDNVNWLKVLEIIDNKYNLVLTYAPQEKDLAEELGKLNNRLNVFRSRSMNDVISLAKRAKLLLTPDTSLVHVAAAFDIPLVGLFSGLNDFYTKFEPLSSIYKAVRSPEGVDGIRNIEPERVIQAVRDIMQDINK